MTGQGKPYKRLARGAKLGGKAFMGAVAVKLELGAEGMTVEPAGAVHQNAGHFAVGIDAQPVPLGTPIKKGSGYQVYEKQDKGRGEVALEEALVERTRTSAQSSASSMSWP